MIDLSHLRATVEGWLVDECQVIEDPEGAHDDPVDVDTGLLVPLDGDETVVYEGPCLVSREVRTQARTSEEGGRTVAREVVRVRLPASASAIVAGQSTGHVVVVTASQGSPTLVGARLRVVESFAPSLATSRILRCVEDDGGTAG